MGARPRQARERLRAGGNELPATAQAERGRGRMMGTFVPPRSPRPESGPERDREPLFHPLAK